MSKESQIIGDEWDEEAYQRDKAWLIQQAIKRGDPVKQKHARVILDRYPELIHPYTAREAAEWNNKIQNLRARMEVLPTDSKPNLKWWLRWWKRWLKN